MVRLFEIDFMFQSIRKNTLIDPYILEKINLQEMVVKLVWYCIFFYEKFTINNFIYTCVKILYIANVKIRRIEDVFVHMYQISIF